MNLRTFTRPSRESGNPASSLSSGMASLDDQPPAVEERPRLRGNDGGFFRAARTFILLAGLIALTACSMPRDTAQAAPQADTTPHAITHAPDEDSPPQAPDESSTRPGKTEPGAAKATGEVDYSCATDADCAVKDVGNCCGYYPACVNVDSPTFPEQVKAACAESGTAGICGFPSIGGCQCVEGRCKGVTGLLPRDEDTGK